MAAASYKEMVRGVSPSATMEMLPHTILHEILTKLDLQSLFATAAVCKTLHFSAYQALSSLPTVDFSEISPNTQILNHVLRSNKVVKSLTLDCSRLEGSAISIFTKEHLEELVLLKCSLPCALVFTFVGMKCPNLRVFTLEVVSCAVLEAPHICRESLAQMLKGCSHIESLCIKFRGADCNPDVFESVEHFLPESIKTLKFRPMSRLHAQQLVHATRFIDSSALSLRHVNFRLQSISLVLDRISDELLISITCKLSLLVTLELEDKPKLEPLLEEDLTNRGLQSLRSCNNLRHLSLVRSREHFAATFSRVTDIGMFLLAEGCENLESIRLGGFSKATDAGFASILHSCTGLRKFEIINAFFLSDLAFHDLVDAPSSLINVRLASCSLITSEAVENLSSCKSLEVLDLWGCKSMADHGLHAVTSLSKLTALNLGGSDVTDSGIAVLGRGHTPIVSLCLRGCKRVTDRGVAYLLDGGGIINQTLVTLDIGYMPRISDRAIFKIARSGRQITDLCIRYCFYVTDASVVALAAERAYGKQQRLLRRLDLCHCSGLSINLLRSLKRPLFYGLRWLGIGSTSLLNEADAGLSEIGHDRPWLTVCLSGCEMGCYDGCFKGWVSND
ncbi:hypothetical protein ACLOJK_041552 [Asimina triloba]